MSLLASAVDAGIWPCFTCPECSKETNIESGVVIDFMFEWQCVHCESRWTMVTRRTE